MHENGVTDPGMRMYYIGDLPVIAICRVIPLITGWILLDNRVFLTEQAKEHAQEKHPDTFLEYLPMLSDLVSHPTYVGLYEKKEFAIELVTPLALRGEHVLVGINLRTISSPSMKNTISSFYNLDTPIFDNRVKSSKLRPIRYLTVDKFL
jgi:hypothetical protein